MINVLSIDGGGIRGIIPALVLQELEERTDRPIAELFDLVAGTSTGGIIALGLTLPDEAGGARPRYSAEDLVDLYWERGRDIFYRSLFRQAMSVVGLKEERYSNAGLRRVLAEYFGDVPMREGLTDVMVTTYDIEDRDPFFFKSWRSYSEDVPMRQAAWATSSAPTYFEPAEMQVGDERHVLIDGGVFVNNPAVSAYAEAKKLYPGEEIRVVSVGTGTTNEPIGYEEAAGWGDLGWARKIIDIVLDGMADAADYQLRYILEDRFERFQVELEAASDALDDASSRNLDRLTQDAERMIEARTDDLTALADALGEEAVMV